MSDDAHPRPWRTADHYGDQCGIVDANGHDVVKTEGSDSYWLDAIIAGMIVEAVNGRGLTTSQVDIDETVKPERITWEGYNR